MGTVTGGGREYVILCKGDGMVLMIWFVSIGSNLGAEGLLMYVCSFLRIRKSSTEGKTRDWLCCDFVGRNHQSFHVFQEDYMTYGDMEVLLKERHTREVQVGDIE